MVEPQVAAAACSTLAAKTRRVGLFVALWMVVLLYGCASLNRIAEPPPAAEKPRTLTIFFDGTSNDLKNPRRSTNVAQLYEMVRAQKNVGTFYIDGVGAQGKPIGLAMAWGIGERVRLAYAYLAEHYQEGDKIYIFGFSRGAYSARILASMLYHAGMPNQSLPAGMTPEALAGIVFEAYKCGTLKSSDDCAMWGSAKRIQRINVSLKDNKIPIAKGAVRVDFMGLWDTVEALGWPDYEENIDVPNPRYADQLCNVGKAAHAVALDDNRARIFTPILLTRRHLLADCGRGEFAGLDDAALKAAVKAKVEEVYFPGAHADVGGGYTDQQGRLDGVSLNWMMQQARDANFPLSAQFRVAEEPLAKGNDPEAEFPFSFFYKRMYRNIDAYADHPDSVTPVVKFHCSLVARFADKARGPAEYGGPEDEYQKDLRRQLTFSRFESCFPEKKGGLREYADPSCDSTKLQVVGCKKKSQ